MDKKEINEALRNYFNDILNRKPTAKELIRKKIIENTARQEKEEYEQKRTKFYNNPLHWDNNKRRRYGFPVLRGKVNKHRSKCYPPFRPTAHLMYIIEAVIDDILTDKNENDKFFNQFVNHRDLEIGDKNTFYINN